MEQVLALLKDNSLTHTELKNALQISGTELSKHLRNLSQRGLVRRVDANWVYIPDTDGGKMLQSTFEGIIRNAHPRLRKS